MLAIVSILLFVIYGARRVTVDRATNDPSTVRYVLAAEIGSGSATLIYIFHPQDCITYRWLTTRWNQFEQDGVVKVVGIPVTLPQDSAVRADLFEGIEFPIRPELGAGVTRLMMEMGYEHTPLSVLIDAEGRIRAVLPPRPPAHDFVRETEIIRELAILAAQPPISPEDAE